ncbi:MAG: FkbM family methyltransferase [Pseudomonadota bacterium]|nr:FkbM family methyltransferase [Pseudomonadota bacterium]
MSRFNMRINRREQREMIRKWRDDGGDQKLRFDYELGRNSLVMDLGGYQGQWASDLYSKYCCRILIFEPVSSFSSQIVDRFRENEDIQVFACGLGATSRAETIYLHGAGSSTFRKRSHVENIQITDVGEWLTKNGIDSVQLMKINIEGGEFELLERLIETRLIGCIENSQVQFHNVALNSSNRMESIQQGMARTHQPIYQYRFVWESWKRISKS